MNEMAFVMDPQIRKEYYTQQLRKINDYCREHSELPRYYRSSGTSMDKHYFLRSSPLNRENMNLEYVFFVHIDNPYRSFQEILSRKKGYTLYPDKLRDGFIHKIDDIESGYRR